jgi:(1->4)-alpha-D-glucan 1-alpha-D-glucosylmutase
MSERRHVGSTYRLQLNGLGFAGATAMVPFMHELGIETCYVSPVTRARANSSHGYDVVDPTALDPALGTQAEFEGLLTALASHGMSLLVDIVPNHMAASVENHFFADVLRHGQASDHAAYFDIAWEEHDGRILLPVLGKPLAEALEAGEIRIVNDLATNEPWVTYFNQRYPVAPGTADGSLPVSTVLSNQHYLLADWRVANTEVNYRRFFDINELIGVRQEDPRVFAETHRLVVELSTDSRIAGFRVDHIDGLYDPAAYLASLRAVLDGAGPQPVILVEKILGRSEDLPAWPVEGTTGYEFGNDVLGLFVDRQGAEAMAQGSAVATGDHRSFAERSVVAKRRVVDTLFAHQVAQVSTLFRDAIGEPASGDPATVVSAVRELTSHLDVYRTYRQADVTARPSDLQRVRAAADRARSQLSSAGASALDLIVDVVSGDLESGSPAWRAVAAWQQLSGPVAAKGVEDTVMYDSGRLLAAADVGTDPDHAAVSVDDLHYRLARRQSEAPFGLSATSTHDSKRSQDVRCRLAVLSEIADDWEATVAEVDGEVAAGRDVQRPDTADRRYVYETLVGAWPVGGLVDDSFARRIGDHLVKAAREAKRHSSWTDPDLSYEDALCQFATRLIEGEPPAGRALIERVVRAVQCSGVTNSLSAVLLKGTAPGVPDIYQGDDSWFFALVDPDNRAPLDVVEHSDLLAGLPGAANDLSDGEEVGALLASWRSGAIKQLVLRTVLHVRREQPHLFARGAYLPLAVTGARRAHVFAFARTHEDAWAVCVVPRLTQSFAGPGRFPIGAEVWSDTMITMPAECPPALVDALTGRSIPVQDGRLGVRSILAILPVALLRGSND